MMKRSLCTALALAVSLLIPTLSFAQASNAPAAAPTAPEAAPAPAPAATETTPAASGERPATYTLQAGDTLESIGKQWGLTAASCRSSIS